MADDGMFLNFAIPESVATKKADRFKGGSWRDRLKARRGIENARSNKSTDISDANSTVLKQRSQGVSAVTEDFPDTRPNKRRRGNEQESIQSNSTSTVPGSRRNNESKTTNAPREVISSLFSYNPTPSTPTVKQPDTNGETEPVKPSNAPLVDGIDTFTSLGLSSVIATHLLTKMNLKTPTAIQKAAVSQMLSEEGDAFIQSETGSGKTLAYLLPLVQRIVTMSEKQKDDNVNGQDPAVHRDSGLFAIVLAPTRELCKQISVVLERLLGCAHYIVAGTVIGGEKKKSEKARLRKGLNILVATPGRLVDHLDNTSVLDVSRVRWLVLDEGDRLMDLGFEEDITKIVKTLDQKKRKSTRPGLPDQRTTILCSATLKMNVQKLGEISLKNAIMIKGDAEFQDASGEAVVNEVQSAFLAPAQLKQSFVVVATKLRLVTLIALLRHTFARKGSVMKAIVFLSCADSVEFHYRVFGRSSLDSADTTNPSSQNNTATDDLPSSTASLLSTTTNPLTLYKLHGSLPQASRTAIVKAFASSTTPSLLLATDVASRGLDLPNLDLVIEYDPAFSAEDHLHRIGRTARLGRDGRAIIFLLPGKEEGYVEVLRNSYRHSVTVDAGSISSSNVTQTEATDILRKGFSPISGTVSTKREWEAKATDFQLDIERWVLESAENKEAAKKAFQSHVRAYATHIAAERKWFDIKELHLGHLAKAFGLRDAPGRVNVVGTGKKRGANNTASSRRGNENGATNTRKGAEIDQVTDEADAAKKMKEKVRNRKMMMGAGADEFNIA